MTIVKFMYNGIKINGKLIKGYWSKANYTNGAKYAFYADSYCSKELREIFDVKNDTDTMTDYFETDTIYFFENNKEIENVLKQKDIRYAKRQIKKYEKIKETRPQYFKDYCEKYYEEYKKIAEVA